jgi:hypothetical protein
MTDHPAAELLVAFADGEEIDCAVDIQRHVSECADCAATVADQRRVATWVARDRDRVGAPGPNAWPALARRVRQSRGRSRELRLTVLAAAAVLVLAVVLRFVPVKGREQAPVAPPTQSLASITTELEQAVDHGRSHLDARTNAAVGSALAVIDGAIRQTEGALAADPGNRYLSEYLGELRRKRIDALRDVLQIIEARA